MTSLKQQPPAHDWQLKQALGVGAALEAKLAKLGLASVFDLLLHAPTRYEDLRQITPIASAQALQSHLFEGQIVSNKLAQGRRQSLLCRLADSSGSVGLRFYHFGAQLARQLTPGTHLRCYGELRAGVTGLELYHPEIQVINPDEPPALDQHLRAVYPSTAGLTQAQLRKLLAQAWQRLEPEALPDPLAPLLADLPDLTSALRVLHYPTTPETAQELSAGAHPAQLRLGLEELAVHQLALLRQRQQVQALPALRLDPESAGRLIDGLLAALQFNPTDAQLRVFAEISADMNTERAMMRLVQGDVGSGKTLVAALAALLAIANGHQAALMAPTEILAEQHFEVINSWFAPLGITTSLVLGKQSRRQKNEQYLRLLSRQAQMVVGTHALIQKPVQIPGLALVIIDEQHRFGVEQRLRLSQDRQSEAGAPHQLILTATPIPRTLAQLNYADLDLSVIDQMPVGRRAVISALIDSQRRAEVVERVEHLLQAGRQCYWVCPFIQESELLNKRAAEQTYAWLCSALPQRRVALLHGKIKAKEKSAVMATFKQGEVDILVATTVIEVGVDCPNAVVMVIENSESMGLAQLHQLRGRVGRGAEQSYCLFLYQGPIAATARKRLQVLKESNSGVDIAETDLKLRGSGELVGTRQSGLKRFRFVDQRRGGALAAQARQLAELLLDAPQPDVELLLRRWGQLGKEYVRA